MFKALNLKNKLHFFIFLSVFLAITNGYAECSCQKYNNLALQRNQNVQKSITWQRQSPNNFVEHINKQYGFKISYPANLTAVSQSPHNYYFLPKSNWRVNGGANGKIIAVIPVYYVKNAPAYPQYYGVEVRIGASSDPQAVKHCFDSDGSLGVTQENINGTLFYVFKLNDAGMMQYMKGNSYRIIHNGACIAIEQLAAGSNYREEASPHDISDATLEKYFDLAGDIVKSFKFSK
jgi:hypothetical protein